MKKTTLLLLSILLFSCKGNQIQETALSYTMTPNKTYSYEFVLSSKALTITQLVDFKLIESTNDSLQMEAAIQDMKWKDDGGELEQETNQYYKDRFINNPFVFTINSQGKILKNLEYKSGHHQETVFDINNFFMELPTGIQKTGDSWTGSRPAVDLIFTRINSKYTFLEIQNDSLAHIKVSSELKSDDEDSVFTKNLKGTYIVNTNNGLLEIGKLEMGGFNGFSNISGTIRIYKK